MKISQETLTLLKNFTLIQPGIVLHPGNKLYCRKDSVLADATVKETFPKQVGLHDTNQLLNLINLYEDPVFDFADDYLYITEANGKMETRYGYAHPEIVSGGKIPKKKILEVPKDVIEFTLTETQWTTLQKAYSILAKDEIKIFSDGQNVRIGIANHKNKKASSVSLELEANANGLKCNIMFSRADLPLLKGSYTGTIAPLYTVFKNTSGFDLSYYVSYEPTTSTFGAGA